jgi:hypothetical protein
MTPEQVMALSTGQLKACYEPCNGQDTNIQIARFLGPYQSGPFNFTACMLFDRRSDTLGRQYEEPAVTDYSKSMQVIMRRNPTDDINVVVIGDPSHVVDTSLSQEPRQNSPSEAFEALPPSSPRAAFTREYFDDALRAPERLARVKRRTRQPFRASTTRKRGKSIRLSVAS